ncbi:MAG TPA: glucose-6-phosphate dehydrogenase [Solirubrobacterales bacterium]|jgi:glucose-6-phosphate 1-dehydrogenase|nr:glucose-6-phosphate dehydrogenase [Solirubrobacterales bacterium]
MSVATASASAQKTAPQIPENQVIVLFGATGDLAKRKLLPGMFHLSQVGLMPRRFRIIGAARHAVEVEEFREVARQAIEASGREDLSPATWDPFAESLRFIGVGDGFGELGEAVADAREELGEEAGLLYYLSLPPKAAAGTVEQLGAAGLGAGARVITEKPFGTDLVSARELNELLHSVFDERCIYRIDHYLGREAVQNLLALRFANGMFEPVWNRNHIDHVQIDIPETLSIEMRGSFYEQTGAFRDMIVTHLFQVLGFVAMEPPTSFEPKALGLEREKVFDSMPLLTPENVVRGQYAGYRDEDGVAADSDTETFVAIKAFIDNWRWEGVPFYLRSGKRLAESRHLLTIAFAQPPRRMFPLDCDQIAESFGHDHLTFELGDPGSISASFLAKVPGPTVQLGEAHMRFSYADTFGGAEQALDAYERLIHDVMVGDRTLFTSSDAIERLWEISEPVLERPPPTQTYEPGSWGPAAIDELIAPRRWHLPNDHV